MKTGRKIERLYEKYDYLAAQYANKVNVSDVSLEKDDIVQELRIKLYSTLKTYVKKFKEWKEQNDSGVQLTKRPLPIEQYLKMSLHNRTKDLFREMNKMNARDYKMEDEIERKKSLGEIDIYANVHTLYPEYWREKISVGGIESSFDVGQDQFNIELDVRKKRLMVGSTDLLQGMMPVEKKFFMLYINGMKVEEINQKYKGKWCPKVCIDSVNKRVRELIPEVVEEVRSFTVMQYDED